MPGALRVLFAPEAVDVYSVREQTPRATLRLVDYGPLFGELREGEPKPCELRFFVSYLKEVRGQVAVAPKLLATLAGEIERSGETLKFEAPDDATLEHLPADPPPEPNDDPRRVKPLEYELVFSADQFGSLDAQRLKVPRVERDDARFVEVRLEVLVGGAAKVTLENSDVWDVPYAPLERRITLTVSDTDATRGSPLIVRKPDGNTVLSDEGKTGERDRKFDLTELEADDDFELELSSGSLRLAPPLTLNIKNLEFGLLLEDAAQAAQAIVTGDEPLPEELSGSEDHDFGDNPFEETRSGRDFVTIRLESEGGAPLAKRPFKAIFADGSSQDGVLDEAGEATLRGIPKGAVQIALADAPDALLTIADGDA